MQIKSVKYNTAIAAAAVGVVLFFLFSGSYSPPYESALYALAFKGRLAFEQVLATVFKNTDFQALHDLSTFHPHHLLYHLTGRLLSWFTTDAPGLHSLLCTLSSFLFIINSVLCAAIIQHLLPRLALVPLLAAAFFALCHDGLLLHIRSADVVMFAVFFGQLFCLAILTERHKRWPADLLFILAVLAHSLNALYIVLYFTRPSSMRRLLRVNLLLLTAWLVAWLLAGYSSLIGFFDYLLLYASYSRLKPADDWSALYALWSVFGQLPLQAGAGFISDYIKVEAGYIMRLYAAGLVMAVFFAMNVVFALTTVFRRVGRIARRPQNNHDTPGLRRLFASGRIRQHSALLLLLVIFQLFIFFYNYRSRDYYAFYPPAVAFFLALAFSHAIKALSRFKDRQRKLTTRLFNLTLGTMVTLLLIVLFVFRTFTAVERLELDALAPEEQPWPAKTAVAACSLSTAPALLLFDPASSADALALSAESKRRCPTAGFNLNPDRFLAADVHFAAPARPPGHMLEGLGRWLLPDQARDFVSYMAGMHQTVIPALEDEAGLFTGRIFILLRTPLPATTADELLPPETVASRLAGLKLSQGYSRHDLLVNYPVTPAENRSWYRYNFREVSAGVRREDTYMHVIALTPPVKAVQKP